MGYCAWLTDEHGNEILYIGKVSYKNVDYFDKERALSKLSIDMEFDDYSFSVRYADFKNQFNDVPPLSLSDDAIVVYHFSN